MLHLVQITISQIHLKLLATSIYLNIGVRISTVLTYLFFCTEALQFFLKTFLRGNSFRCLVHILSGCVLKIINRKIFLYRTKPTTLHFRKPHGSIHINQYHTYTTCVPNRYYLISINLVVARRKVGLSFSGADAGVLVLKVFTVTLTKSCSGLLGLLGSLGFKSREHEFTLCTFYM
jgi:hypothetical protein